MVSKVPHFEIANRESDDGCLVELAGDGCWERQQLGQLIELKVFFSPAGACSVSGFLLSQCL